MIYTSYYAQCRDDTVELPDGCVGKTYSISVQPPWFWKPKRHYPKLAPTWEIVSDYKDGIIDQTGYVERYLDLLDNERKLNPEQVLIDLPDNAVLLCYEKPEDFCHRHIVAWWFEQHCGVEVPELPVYDTKGNLREPQPVEGLLTF